ncbi:hypothetical protein ANO14919_099210 [Xylariales sp. No.14919]|nr:hypothetical protein ANO14919_099210 [Xylariales sp. No.14919]
MTARNAAVSVSGSQRMPPLVLKWTLNAPEAVLNGSIKSLYLNRRHTVLSIDSVASRGIPTCPYKWPNGQSDIPKFLEGEDNSLRWFKEHGRIYRLWAGISPEIVLTQSKDVKYVFKDSDLNTKAIDNDAG